MKRLLTLNRHLFTSCSSDKRVASSLFNNSKLIASNKISNFSTCLFNKSTTQKFDEKIDVEIMQAIQQRIKEYNQKIKDYQGENKNINNILTKEELKDFASCHNNTGYYYLNQLNKPKEALFYFLQSLKYNSNDPVILFNTACLFERENRIDSASSLFLKCLQIDPYFIDAKLHICAIFLQSKDLEESSKYQCVEFLYKDLITTHNHINSKLELALLYARKGEYQQQVQNESLEILDDLLSDLIDDNISKEVDVKLSERNAPEEYKTNLIEIIHKFMKGYTKKEMHELLEGIEQVDNNNEELFDNEENTDLSYRYQQTDIASFSDIINVKCYLLKQFKRVHDACTLYKFIIERFEKKKLEDNELFELVTEIMDVNLLTQAVDLIPENQFPRIYMNYGILLNSKGQVDESLKQLEKAMDLSKGRDTEILSCLAYYMQEKNFKVSEMLYKRVLSLQPDHFQHYIAYSNFLYLHGRMGEAIGLLERTMKRYPQMSEALSKQIELLKGVSNGNFSGAFGFNQQ